MKLEHHKIATITPEADTFMHFLMRNESIRNLENQLQEKTKITQEFLKHALGVLLHANMDLEHKLSIALLKIDYLECKGNAVKRSAEYFAQKITKNDQ